MKKTVFMDKYPVYTLSLKKSEVKYTHVSEIVDYFKAKIEVVFDLRKRQFSSYLFRNSNQVYVYTRSLAPF